MIANFFRRLDEHGVDWLLISGQATILYGAATFSEDVDVWVEPSDQNLRRCTLALRAAGARYYKLTPPLTSEFALRHHGFHFTLPEAAREPAAFLDLMGRPPRVGPFAEARARARVFETEWGPLPTVAIVDLVELKKTQRPRDYPIISRLALARVEEEGSALSDRDLLWAFDNVFTLSEFRRLTQAVAGGARVLPDGSVARRAAAALVLEGDLEPALEDELEESFDARMAPLRRADRRFWRAVIDELRSLRADGRLATEGSPV
jgi:hypothetical protein